MKYSFQWLTQKAPTDPCWSQEGNSSCTAVVQTEKDAQVVNMAKILSLPGDQTRMASAEAVSV